MDSKKNLKKMDRKLLSLAIALCLTLAQTLAENKVATSPLRGYLLTSMRVLEVNRTNMMHLRMYRLFAPGKVIITLKNKFNDSIVTEEEYEVEKDVEDVVALKLKLFVPQMEELSHLVLQVNGSFDTPDGYTIYGEDTVRVTKVHESNILIQTDKPFYKPGQTVKFRILRLNNALRPVLDGQPAEVYIENPESYRIAQWKNVFLTDIKQLEMLLSNEPLLGSWKIVVDVGGQTEKLHFDVKEYVLPKFEVTITPPSYVLVDAETLTVKICANYTYGKPVTGTVKVATSLKEFSWAFNSKVPTVKYEQKVDGCIDYTVNLSLVDHEGFSFRKLQMVVSFTEEGTGITRNTTTNIDRIQKPFHIEFLKGQRSSFKPGLPYSGQVMVTLPDSTPAKGESCQICHIVKRERVLFEWQAHRTVRSCKNFTTDEYGIIYFTIPAQNTDAVSMFIEVKSMRYENFKSARYPMRKIIQPHAIMTVKPYYSLSGSFIQIKEEPATIPCGVAKDITLLFTSAEIAKYQIFYEVISKGKVLTTNYLDVKFNRTEDDVSDSLINPSTLVDGDLKILVPSDSEPRTGPPASAECYNFVHARYGPPVGSTVIPLQITPEMSSSFRLLVYYIREDKEVVSDSHKFEVEKCFSNKVSLLFGDEVKQPGSTTSLTLRAAPNSLCGIRVMDKSVELMDSADPLSLDKVFKYLQRFDTNYYDTRNHCRDKNPQPGLVSLKSAAGTVVFPPPSWSYTTSYVDSMTAFEKSGFLVISDLLMLTKPCNGREYAESDDYSIFASSGGSGGARALPIRKDKMDYSSGSERTKSVVNLRTFFPEDWLFYLQGVGPSGEYITKERLPHTVTDWVGSAVCLNNEQGLGLSNKSTIRGFQEFFMDFDLPYSVVRGEKPWINLTVFNYLDKALAINAALDQSKSFVITNGSINGDYCILGGKSLTLRVQVQGIDLSTVNFTVRAKNAVSLVACEGQEIATVVVMDGITKSIIVEPEGFKQQKVISALFTPKDSKDGVFSTTFSFPLPNDLVADSARAYLRLSGDIMGPTIHNMERLVVLPTGCGEQNIATFAPIVYVLNYLTVTNRLSDEIQQRALRYLRIGYQRQMKYAHPDGSYSIFGVSDSGGSIFLTALVVKSFAEAKKYTPVDDEDLDESLKWIVSNQQQDGCFPEVGKTLDKGLKGGLDDKKNDTAGLNALILVSLMSAGLKNDSVISPALSCIQKDESSTPYKSALYAYASVLASKSLGVDNGLYKKYNATLYDKRNETGDALYFPNLNGCHSMNIQTAAYAVLAALEAGGTAEQCLPIVRYLSTMRNSIGGFSSTLDTVLALEAVSKFAVLISKIPIDITVETTGSLTQMIRLTEEYKLVVQSYELKMPLELAVKATGPGTALLQVDIRYNTLLSPQSKSFNISAVLSCQEKNCSRGDLEVCASYLPEKKTSNMAIVQVQMISNLAADKDSLNKLLEDNNKTLMKHFEIENNNVVFYFDEFGNDKICIKFVVVKTYDMDNCQPGIVTVTDYYSKENFASTQYTNVACSTSNPVSAG